MQNSANPSVKRAGSELLVIALLGLLIVGLAFPLLEDLQSKTNSPSTAAEPNTDSFK